MTRNLLMSMVAVLALVLVPVEARAEKDSCLDLYLLCLNGASQESGVFWRTLKEAECGVDYYACIRRKVIAT